MIKSILLVILLVFGLYKLWKYLANRHFESTRYIKQIEETKCEALAPAKHNTDYDDPWD